MSNDAVLAFAEEVGSHFSQRYALPPLTGRTLGWLLICQPAQQTAAEIAEGLRASRGGISTAVSTLEAMGYVRRRRAAGERVDLIEVDPSAWSSGLDGTNEFVVLADLARSGLRALEDAAPARRARLAEMAAFADFFAERMPALMDEWRHHRDELRRSGELPPIDRDGGPGRERS